MVHDGDTNGALRAVRDDDAHCVPRQVLDELEEEGLIERIEYWVLTYDGEEAIK